MSGTPRRTYATALLCPATSTSRQVPLRRRSQTIGQCHGNGLGRLHPCTPAAVTSSGPGALRTRRPGVTRQWFGSRSQILHECLRWPALDLPEVGIVAEDRREARVRPVAQVVGADQTRVTAGLAPRWFPTLVEGDTGGGLCLRRERG